MRRCCENNTFFFLPFLLRGRDGRVINCAGRWGIYVQVQMEVTSDLSCGIRPALSLHDNGLLRQWASALCPSSLHTWCYFLNVGILSRLSPSQPQMSAACCTKEPSNIFWIPPGATEVICQPVTQSVGNACFMLLAEWASSLQRLLSNTVAERHCGSGAQCESTLLFQAFSCDVVIFNKEVHL